MKLESRSATLRADITFDARPRNAGYDARLPFGIGEVTVTVNLDTDASPEDLNRLATLMERDCVVRQGLRTSPRIVVRV